MQAWWDHGLGCRNPATGSIVFMSVGENSPVKKKTRKKNKNNSGAKPSSRHRIAIYFVAFVVPKIVLDPFSRTEQHEGTQAHTVP